MARVTGKHVTGVLGPVTLRRYRKKQTMSIRSGEKIKQTVATKKCSSTFGKANMLVQSVRSRFAPYTRDFCDGTMYNRMNSVMSMIFYESIDTETMEFSFTKKSFDKLSGFDFNIKSPLIHSLRVKPEVSLDEHDIVIKMDELKIPVQLKFPAKSQFCKITFSIVLYRLKEALMIGIPEEQSLVISKNQKVFEAQEFRFRVPAGCLCLLGCFLDFYCNSGEFQLLQNNEVFNPAAILSALISPGEYQKIDNRRWRKMPGLDWKPRRNR